MDLPKLKHMEKIVIDTNFFVENLRWKVGMFRAFREKEVCVIEPVLKELSVLAEKKGKTAVFAKLALKQVSQKGLKTLNVKERSADAALFSLSKQGYFIATQDKVLRQRIQRAKGNTIFIRQKKYVVMK
jgi:rRNA-processing protein FCF1